MRTAFRTSQGWTGTADYSLSKFVPHPKGNLGTEKKDTPATGKHNAFLTGRITPLAPDYWHQDMDNDSPVNLTTPENFDYLYRSASRYAELMGIKLPFRYRKGGCPRLNITELYRVMEECVPECINLEKKSGRLHFCLFRHHDWPEPALFWIPVDFTERLPVPLKDIVREFIRQFVRHHGLYDVTETFYYDFAIEELEDWGNRDSDASPKEIRANRRLADSYQSGKRMKALRRMSGKPFCKSLEEAVRNYRTKKEKELKLLELIEDGMALITPESPVLTGYQYDWAYEEECDFPPVGMESQVMLVYSTGDTLTECVKEYMNSDYREVYALTPVTYKLLTPETDCLFQMDDYPERLSRWLVRFTDYIDDNF